jgi:hypothetical protein
MIVHMVLFRMRKDLTKQQIEHVFRSIGELKGKIPGIVSYSWGKYSSPEGLNKGFTHGFCTTFTDAKARDAYLPHPEHKKVVEIVLPTLEGGLDGVIAFDYEA